MHDAWPVPRGMSVCQTWQVCLLVLCSGVWRSIFPAFEGPPSAVCALYRSLHFGGACLLLALCVARGQLASLGGVFN